MLDNIRCIFGPKVATELLPLAVAYRAERQHGRGSTEAHDNVTEDGENINDENFWFEVKGFVSNANFNQKKCVFILFINHRLVDCAPLKKLMLAIYAQYLPRGCHPFIAINLNMRPQALDVNVHPTKREVSSSILFIFIFKRSRFFNSGAFSSPRYGLRAY